MKCKNCHGEIISIEDNCPYCNYNEIKNNRYYNIFERYIKGILKWKRIVPLFLIIIIFIYIIESLIDGFIGTGILLTILSIINTIIVFSTVVFVILIAIILIINGINYIGLNSNIQTTMGHVVDNKNEKEIFIGGKGYLPIIEFEVNTRKYRCFGDNNKKKIELNKEYQVFYNCNYPYYASVHKHKNGWISLLAGIFILLSSLLVLFL